MDRAQGEVEDLSNETKELKSGIDDLKGELSDKVRNLPWFKKGQVNCYKC